MDSLQNECINEETVTSNKPIANVAADLWLMSAGDGKLWLNFYGVAAIF